MSIGQEMLLAKGKNWAKLVAQKADEITESIDNETDCMLKTLSGEVFERAVLEVALDIKSGKYDKMLMPKEYNL